MMRAVGVATRGGKWMAAVKLPAGKPVAAGRGSGSRLYVAVAMVMARAEVVGDEEEWWECMVWAAASSREPAGVAT